MAPCGQIERVKVISLGCSETKMLLNLCERLCINLYVGFGRRCHLQSRNERTALLRHSIHGATGRITGTYLCSNANACYPLCSLRNEHNRDEKL